MELSLASCRRGVKSRNKLLFTHAANERVNFSGARGIIQIESVMRHSLLRGCSLWLLEYLRARWWMARYAERAYGEMWREREAYSGRRRQYILPAPPPLWQPSRLICKTCVKINTLFKLPYISLSRRRRHRISPKRA